MNREEIRATLKSIFEMETGDVIPGLPDELVPSEEFELDSVDMVSLIMHVESHFRIRTTHDELAQAVNVGALLDLVEAKIQLAAGLPSIARAA